MHSKKVDLFIPTYNRLEYVKVCLESVFEATDPKLVNQLIVVDGRSEDGTDKYVKDALKKSPFKSTFLSIPERHVVHAMLAAKKVSQSTIIAKIDSDTVPCPGWLGVSLDVIHRHPKLWALGVLPRTPSVVPPREGERRDYRPVSHVGGVGLFRAAAWDNLMPGPAPFHGWTAHQRRSSWEKGWIRPDLPIFLLDQMPFEPFIRLRQHYFKKGWHRTNKSGRSLEWKSLWSWKFPDWESAIKERPE